MNLITNFGIRILRTWSKKRRRTKKKRRTKS